MEAIGLPKDGMPSLRARCKNLETDIPVKVGQVHYFKACLKQLSKHQTYRKLYNKSQGHIAVQSQYTGSRPADFLLLHSMRV